MSMFVFMCMYYNQSLNAIRQWLVIGIYMYGVQYLLKKKPVQYFIVSVMAILFHSSAVITIPIYFIYHFLKGENKHRKRSMLILSATVIAVIFFDKICLTMIGMGILPMKYAHYFTEAEGTSSLVMQILSRVPLLLGCFILRKQLRRYDEKANIWIVFLLIDLFVGMLGASFGYASRCSLYFGVWQCMFMSEVYVVLRKRVQPMGRMFVTVGVDGMLLLYWYYCYVVRTFSLTYPYVSDVISWIN